MEAGCVVPGTVDSPAVPALPAELEGVSEAAVEATGLETALDAAFSVELVTVGAEELILDS